jgi:8-oxo-dGTP pyrophosphatase MutT (NUDIX family)
VATSALHIAAAVIFSVDSKTLLVRKRGSPFFMQAGGKIEPGEQPLAALIRELGEELGLVVELQQARWLGRFGAPAANEPGLHVEAELFEIAGRGDVTIGAEIDEITWIDPWAPGSLKLAPLTRGTILPLCQALLRDRAG